MDIQEKHKCSECIHKPVCEWAVYQFEITCNDYMSIKCPNCGADMRGGDDHAE